jgi:hypothetical protein
MIDERAAQGSIQLFEALQVALVADPHLVHAPVGLEPEPLGHLAPLVVGGDAVLAAQLLDQLEELVEVDVRVADAGGAVDGCPTVVHVLVQLCNCIQQENFRYQCRGSGSGQCCGSGMFIPDPRTELIPSRFPDPNFSHPRSRIRIKEFMYFNPKILF